MGYRGHCSLAAKGISFSAAPSAALGEEITIVSMPGGDQAKYNDVAKICLEDTIGFAVVWESDWGDMWFYLWLRNVLEAHLAGHRLVVLTYGKAAQRANVGRAQSTEVAAMQVLRIAYEWLHIDDFLEQRRPLHR